MTPAGPVHYGDDDDGSESSFGQATHPSSPKPSPAATSSLRRRRLRVPAAPLAATAAAAAATAAWPPPSSVKDCSALLSPTFMADVTSATSWLALVIPSPPESATPEDTDAETDATGSSCPPSPASREASPFGSHSSSSRTGSRSASASASRRRPAPLTARPFDAAETTYFQPVRLGGGIPHAGRVLEFVVFVAVAGWAWSCAVDWLWLARSATTYSTLPDLAARAADSAAAFVCLIIFVAEWWRVNVVLGSIFFSQQREHAAGDLRS
ncbi:hypothetical protein HK405_013862 [Cladochytrium tenue]|nr:hypothetical protein HK405_013862 [Cladochytrium tenue]